MCFDAYITNTEFRSVQTVDQEKQLKRKKQAKKDKHLGACHECRRYFTLLAFTVNIMCGRKAKMIGYVRSRMQLAVVQANTMLSWGERLNASGLRLLASRRKGWGTGGMAQLTKSRREVGAGDVARGTRHPNDAGTGSYDASPFSC